jgi:hypothetical protein
MSSDSKKKFLDSDLFLNLACLKQVMVDCVCRMEKMIYAFKKGNFFFLKFTKHFLSNGNHFSVDYYFCSHQIPKNTIIFQKSFYAKTNRA